MTDISLSVGLDTGKANGTLNNLIKKLDAVDKANEKLIKSNDRIRDSLNKVGTGAKFATVLLNKYKTQLDSLAKTSGSLVTSSNAIASALGGLSTGSNKASSGLSGLDASLVKVISKSSSFKDKLKSTHIQMGNLKGHFDKGKISATQYASGIKSLEARVLALQSATQRANKTLLNTGSTTMTAAKGNAVYNKGLNHTSRAAFRAASANRENNAILSDQVGFWRFAARGAALYFSSLATDRLVAVNLEMQSLQQALNVIGGSQEAGAESMEFITDTAQRLGLEIGSLATGYKLFSASTRETALEGAITNDIFESVAEAASAMKLSVADTDGVMRALSQIMSKGKVSSEELRQQLGDRLPRAFQTAAKAMNVTTAELNKMLENGEVMSEEFLPKFAKELRNTFQTTPELLAGPDKAINRMKNSFVQLAVDIGNAGLNEAIVKISDSLRSFAESEEAQKLVEGFGNAAVWVANNIEDLTDAVGILLAVLATKTIANTAVDMYTLAGSMNDAFATTGKLKRGLTGVFAAAAAFGVGFQIGDILVNQFNEARLAGSYLVQGLLGGWEILKTGTQIAWNLMELSIKSVFLGIPALAIEAVNATIDKFKGLVSYLDKTFGTDLASSINFEALKVDNEPLAQLTTEVEENKTAWSKLKDELKSQNDLFVEQRKMFEEQGKAAKKAGMTIGEYLKSIEDAEKALNKKAKIDAKAAKRAKELSQAEKELAKVRKAENIKKSLKDYDELVSKYDKTKKATLEQKEAFDELFKIFKTGNISASKFNTAQDLIRKSFQSQLNPVQDVKDEMELLTEAFGKFNTEAERKAYIKAFKTFGDKNIATNMAKITNQAEHLKKSLKFDEGSSLANNLLEGFDSIAGNLGESLGDAFRDGEWEDIGEEIGGLLSSSIGKSLGNLASSGISGLAESVAGGIEGSLGSLLGSLAGPIGSFVGGLATSVVGGLFADDFVDPTKKRQEESGTGSVLGDIKAKTQSLVNSGEIIASTNGELVNINKGMLSALTGVNESISGFTAEIGRSEFSEISQIDSKSLRGRATQLNSPLGSFGPEFDPNSVQDQIAQEVVNQVGLGRIRVVDTGVKLIGGTLGEILNDTADGALVQAYVDIQRRKTIGSDKFTTITRSLGDNVNSQFTEVLSGIVSTVESGIGAFGIDPSVLETALASVSIDAQDISLEGLSTEEGLKQFQEVFGKVFDDLTAATIPWLDGMQMAGEGLGETLTRVSTEFGLAQEAYEVLGFGVAETMGDIWGPATLAMVPLGDAIKDLAVPTELLVSASSDLVAKAGGIEAFTAALAGFEQNFLDPSEQIVNQGRRLGSALSEVGLELPATREGFRQLMEAQVATTESGRQNIATLLNLQGAADGYYSQVESQTVGLSQIRDLELRLMEAQGDQAGLLAAKRQDELDALEGLANADQAKELLAQIWELEDAAGAAGDSIQDLTANLQSMVDAAVDAFFALDFQAFNLDGSDITGAQVESISKALVNGVGDINSFNAAVSTFSSNFLNEEAKFTKSSGNVAAAFAKYNAEIPATRQGFTDLFQSLNAVTDADAIADALKIAEDANTYYAFLEKQAESIYSLELRLLKAQGEETAALAKTRQKELDAANDTEKSLLRQIFAAEDLTKANEERLDRESQLLEEVADVQDRINDAYREQISNLDATASRMRGLNESLRDFGTDLALGDLSALSPQEQLALARSDFESTASAAQSGDINALERLQSVAQAFLEESREFQGSGGTFAEDFQRVQDVISNSATVADIQADQAERQSMLMERQLERQQENNEDTKSIKEALLALIAVQKESGLLSLSELEAMKRSLNILESNSSLSTSQI